MISKINIDEYQKKSSNVLTIEKMILIKVLLVASN